MISLTKFYNYEFNLSMTENAALTSVIPAAYPDSACYFTRPPFFTSYACKTVTKSSTKGF
jgi:hypothetical protein